MSKHHREVDEATGVEVTGHVWDGDLKELNNPLPKWWLYTMYLCTIWAIGYWVLYPAWPTADGYTKGVLGYSQRETVMREVKEGRKAQDGFRKELAATPLADVKKKPEVLRFANAIGAAAFGDNCSPCHGRGAQGATGYPNLNDDDWIWGGGVEDIHKTISFGIRGEHNESRLSEMPKFGVDKLLEPAQINDTAEFVLSMSKKSSDAAAAGRGSKLYAENCAACHGEKGEGNKELGAPNLSDAIWLYGNRKEDVVASINTGRGGKMPGWAGRLDDVTVKALAVYVHNLGGGK